MKVTWSWLLELVDLPTVPTVEQGAAALTRVGIEIEGITDLGAAFSGVVIAEVVGKRPHPQSQKLTLVDVITEHGGAATQVVCGASNVPEPGRRVLWARPGATLPGGMTLAVKPVKGIDSPGMLCSEPELGIGDDAAGIIVLDPGDRGALGGAAQTALGLDDHLLEVNAPANRPDLLGHLGVARELVAVLGGRVVPPAESFADITADLDAAALVKVDIDDPSGCPRYVARVIDGVTVRPSPRRIAARLRAVGVRPISNLVDVTNYVMFELGQPLHAFDWANVADHAIRVRRARDGESMVTLDGVTRVLTGSDLLICDGARPVAIAGVMGGQNTEVEPTTSRVLLEAASFDPLVVRRVARRLNLPSEASQRFGRGVDPELAGLASMRAAGLIARLGGGKVAVGAVDVYPTRRTVAAVPLRLARLRSLTGVDAFSGADAADALTRLGCAVEVTNDRDRVSAGSAAFTIPDLSVTPPSARTDLTREVDLIEEVLRLRGFDQVEATLPALRAAPIRLAAERPDQARRILAAAGLAEAITFGFTSFDRVAALELPGSDRRSFPIPLRNPMSNDQAVMRTSLLPNLVAAVARNRSFGRDDVALFEVGSVFLRRGGLDSEIRELADEPVWAAAVLSGRRPGRLGRGAAYDFFDAKGLVEHLVARLGAAAELRAVTDVPYLHPGVAAAICVAPHDVPIGWVGEVHPDVRLALGVDAPVFTFELDLEQLPPATPAQMRTIPKFPASSRDVSLLVGESIPAGRVRELIGSAREPLVERVDVLEDYRDAKLPAGTKSMLWTIRYRAADRTLTDAEVDAAHEGIVAQLVDRLPAQRR
jgi:phenylalanyl-tRNA synthetase beta chain